MKLAIPACSHNIEYFHRTRGGQGYHNPIWKLDPQRDRFQRCKGHVPQMRFGFLDIASWILKPPACGMEANMIFQDYNLKGISELVKY